jgi:glycosyltransferase involved in cell wall biosynthesis
MLSIIIPTLNEQKHLPHLLEAIREQRLTEEHEVVITDAGSQDATLRVASEHGCRVASGGLPAKGRNQGAKAALGDLLLFLDPEALLPKGFLAHAVAEFRRRRLDVASCRLEPIVEKWMPRFTFPRFFYDLCYNWPARLLEGAYPYASALIMVTREMHERLEGFDELIQIGEDHDYARRAARLGRVGLLRFGKLPLFMRRCQREGIIKTHLKYQLCHLYNLVFGQVRTNVFRYNFGQYKTVGAQAGTVPPRRVPITQFAWTITYYGLLALGLAYWTFFIALLSPRLVKWRMRGLARWVLRCIRRDSAIQLPASPGDGANGAEPVIGDAGAQVSVPHESDASTTGHVWLSGDGSGVMAGEAG